jgi:Uma2 family endonuclease
MPTAATREKKQQERWNEIASDPLLTELPYKVETNSRGQLILSPHKAAHADAQGDIIALLSEYAKGGLVRPEFPVVTRKGTKVVDIAWITADRREQMEETGDPPTLAPEICIEVLSESNDWDEMEKKRTLYRDAGAEEVWIVTEERQVRFFVGEELSASTLIPDFPAQL